MADTLFTYGKFINPLYFVANYSQRAKEERNRLANKNIDITSPTKRDIAIREWAKLVQRFGLKLHAVKLYGYQREYHILDDDTMVTQIHKADDSYVNGILYENVPFSLRNKLVQKQLSEQVKEPHNNFEYYDNNSIDSQIKSKIHLLDDTDPSIRMDIAHKTILKGILYMSTTDQITAPVEFLTNYYGTTYRTDSSEPITKDSTYDIAVRMLEKMAWYI